MGATRMLSVARRGNPPVLRVSRLPARYAAELPMNSVYPAPIRPRRRTWIRVTIPAATPAAQEANRMCSAGAPAFLPTITGSRATSP